MKSYEIGTAWTTHVLVLAEVLNYQHAGETISILNYSESFSIGTNREFSQERTTHNYKCTTISECN